MFGAIAVLLFLPWLDTSKVRSTRYRPVAKRFFWAFVVVCLVLGWLGGQAGGRDLHHPGPHPDRCLLRLLPDRPADAVADGEDPAVAELDCGRRAGAVVRAEGQGIGVDRGDRGARRLAGGRRRSDRQGRRAAKTCRPSLQLVVRRAVRHLRSGAAAARLSGLQGGLRGLSLDEVRPLPQPRGAGWSGLQPRRGQGVRRRAPASRTARTTPAKCTIGPAVSPTRSRRPMRTSRPPLRQWRCGVRRTCR